MPLIARGASGDIRMIRMILPVALVALMLAACGRESETAHRGHLERQAVANYLEFAGAGGDVRFAVEPSRGVSHEFVLAQLASPRPSQQSGRVSQIAVTRGFTLRLPSNEVTAVQQRHLAECAKLGCTVLETRLDRLSEGRVSARASVRIEPDHYPAFAAVITAPPAEVTTQSERAEDMTVTVLDVDKRLEVKTALRDRLAAMLNDPAAKSAADLAAIEKELAQAQGDIEAIIAQRDYLRSVTQTVRVDIYYDGRPGVVAGYDFSPIKRAADGIGQTLITSVASLIVALTALVPWLPVVVLVVWGVLWGLRRRRQTV
jgi:hypothetical protein